MNRLTIVDASGVRLPAQITEYARYGSLFWFLMLRDLKLRYRRTSLGLAWAVIQPLLPMAIFAAIFARLLDPQTGRLPYWLFALAGFAPWSFFANAVLTSSPTFFSNQNLLNKVYFPRAILPAAATAGCILDWLVSSVLLLCITVLRDHRARATWLLLPVIVAGTVCLAMAVGLGLACLTAMNRDIRHALPFLVQVWMYATPVVYPLSMVPHSLQLVIALNPMTGIVESFRWCLFGTPPDWIVLGLSAFTAALIVLASLLLFVRLEADLAEQP